MYIYVVFFFVSKRKKDMERGWEWSKELWIELTLTRRGYTCFSISNEFLRWVFFLRRSIFESQSPLLAFTCHSCKTNIYFKIYNAIDNSSRHTMQFKVSFVFFLIKNKIKWRRKLRQKTNFSSISLLTQQNDWRV